MIRGEIVDKIYKDLQKYFAEIALPEKLNWEEARCILLRMNDDINDNLMEAFWSWKHGEGSNSKPVDTRNNPYY